MLLNYIFISCFILISKDTGPDFTGNDVIETNNSENKELTPGGKKKKNKKNKNNNKPKAKLDFWGLGSSTEDTASASSG